MNYAAFLQNTLFPSPYPPYLIFFVTQECNMKCVHCFYWKALNKSKNELNLNEIEKISQSLPNLFFLRITGGEPFLRKDIYQIINFFYRNSSIRRVAINTNGLLVDDIVNVANQTVTTLKGLHLEIGISIDHLREKHDEIRSFPGAFKKAMHTYRELIKIKGDHANLKVGFLITAMKGNQQALGEICQYLRAQRPDSIGLNMIRGSPKDISQLEIDVAKYDECRLLLNEYNFENISERSWIERLRITKTLISQEIIINTLKTNKARVGCAAADKIAVLYPSGDLAACELLEGNLGNIRDYACDFRKIWKEKIRKELVRHIRKSGCFCTHECFITADLIFRLKNIFWILANFFAISVLSLADINRNRKIGNKKR